MSAVKADRVAADRLLKAAVRRARTLIADGGSITHKTGPGTYSYTYRPYDRAAVVAMLTEAGRSAELLLAGGDS